jgi:uncharacterized repeat protein (TIGR03803 family)
MNCRSLLNVLIVGFCLTTSAPAQNFKTLHTFTSNFPSGTNIDGVVPGLGLVLADNVLYGTAQWGGSQNAGTIFRVNTDGTGFTNLHNFDGIEGSRPIGPMTLSSNVLYGTTLGGGPSDQGTIFAIGVDGTGFTNLYNFLGNSNGASPFAGLLLAGNSLYGVARFTGAGFSGDGTIFKLNLDGTGFSVLHTFVSGPYNSGGASTNSEGSGPNGDLVLAGNTLYGMTIGGGNAGVGTIFAIHLDGTGFTNLHSFSDSDGNYPVGSLVASGGVLYGVTIGGNGIDSTLFKLNVDGTGFATLRHLTGLGGADPVNGLTLCGNVLYGTATLGGNGGNGTVFSLKTDGTDFTVLYSFPPGGGAANPTGRLSVSGVMLYGPASFMYGPGPYDYGSVYSLLIPPRLTITPLNGYVTLTWPTNYANFKLQSTANPGSAASWTIASQIPVVTNGQNMVTNPVSGAQQFYRLIQSLP